MHAEGVEVRPLKMVTGHSEFNEVFFNDVFVPDDDVVGPSNGGWTVARRPSNESVSIGGGQGGGAMPADMVITPFDAHPERLAGGRSGRALHCAERGHGSPQYASAHRAVIRRGGPRARGQRHQTVLSEAGHEPAAIICRTGRSGNGLPRRRRGDDVHEVLMHRGLSIAGGTSEIQAKPDR